MRMTSQILTFRTSVKLSKQRRNRDEELQVGYIEFDDVNVTESAYGEGRIDVDGESHALHYAKRKEQRLKEKMMISNKKLFVSGLPGDMSKDELCSLLGDCKISGAEEGKSYVFAEYKSRDEQEKALSRLNTGLFKGVKLFVTPAYEKASLSNGRLNSSSSSRRSPGSN